MRFSEIKIERGKKLKKENKTNELFIIVNRILVELKEEATNTLPSSSSSFRRWQQGDQPRIAYNLIFVSKICEFIKRVILMLRNDGGCLLLVANDRRHLADTWGPFDETLYRFSPFARSPRKIGSLLEATADK